MRQPWELALHEIVQRTQHTAIDWMLVGSAVLAVYGLPLQPGDLDLSGPTPAQVASLVDRFTDRMPTTGPLRPPNTGPNETWCSIPDQPVVTFSEAAWQWTFGRWYCDGWKVEVASITAPDQDQAVREVTGGRVWQHRRFVPWHDAVVPVVPLEVLFATTVLRYHNDTSARMRQRADAITTVLQQRPYDQALLVAALEGVGMDPGVGLQLLSASEST